MLYHLLFSINVLAEKNVLVFSDRAKFKLFFSIWIKEPKDQFARVALNSKKYCKVINLMLPYDASVFFFSTTSL